MVIVRAVTDRIATAVTARIATAVTARIATAVTAGNGNSGCSDGSYDYSGDGW